MGRQTFINMEHEIFRGNILDIGLDNHGIIYSLFKQYDNDVRVDYLEGTEKKYIEKESYDTCILFFSLNEVWFDYNKIKLINDIRRYLKVGGVLYIWDMDKGYLKTAIKKIKVVLPDKSIKEFQINDINVFKDNSKDNIMNMVGKYFDIIDTKYSDDIYFIKCTKRGRETNESKVNSN